VTQLTEDDQYAYWLQVQSAGDPAMLIGEVRAAFGEIDGNLPILEVQTIAGVAAIEFLLVQRGAADE
jgi:hypothetical protein